MPFTTPEARRMTDILGPKEVGDRCFLFYRAMVRRWTLSPRWTTAHEIYVDVFCTQYPDSRHPDDKAALELAWQVFFAEKVMPYELAKKALNGDVQ